LPGKFRNSCTARTVSYQDHCLALRVGAFELLDSQIELVMTQRLNVDTWRKEVRYVWACPCVSHARTPNGVVDPRSIDRRYFLSCFRLVVLVQVIDDVRSLRPGVPIRKSFQKFNQRSLRQF